MSRISDGKELDFQAMQKFSKHYYSVMAKYAYFRPKPSNQFLICKDE
ncbi:MAG: hypothetical protein WCI06_07155 [Methylococcaceae bacterium]